MSQHDNYVIGIAFFLMQSWGNYILYVFLWWMSL